MRLMMVDILDEAIDDIKQERIQTIFFKYGKFLVILLIAFVIGGVGHLWWKSYQENKNYALGSEYMVALLKLQTKDYQQGIDILERLTGRDTSYSALAGLDFASMISARKEYSRAAQIYKLIAEDKNYHQLFKDFASLMQISMKLHAKEIDANTGITEYQNYIKTDPIFKASAQEQLSAIYLSLGEKEKAKQVLIEIIASSSTPDRMRERAEQIMVLTAK